jgi:Fur family transcriptional regulator, stress-responsive regulator
MSHSGSSRRRSWCISTRALARLAVPFSSVEGLIFESVQKLSYSVGMATDPADLLRQRGIQVTAQRLAVVRAVSGQPHITADGVAEVVRTEIGAISLQSVYDALGVLVAEGLIRRIQPAGSPARFEDRVGDNHHHLICRICGRLVDVDCAVGSAPCLTAADDMGYEIDEAEVAYWGRCPDCLAQARAPSRSDPPIRARRNPRKVARTEGPTVPSPDLEKNPLD